MENLADKKFNNQLIKEGKVSCVSMGVNVDVEHAGMDERMEGHDDVDACVRTYNNNITAWYLFLLFSEAVFSLSSVR